MKGHLNLNFFVFAACMDSQSQTFCNYWKMDCSSLRKGQGEFMRLRCPVTCGVPCSKFHVQKKNIQLQ